MIKEYIYTEIRKTEFEKPIDDNLLYRATSLKKTHLEDSEKVSGSTATYLKKYRSEKVIKLPLSILENL